MVQIIAVTVVILYALIQEIFIRDKSAKSFRRDSEVDATTAFYVICIFLCLIGAPILSSMNILVLPQFVIWIGFGILVAGIVIRAVAMLQLGKFYTRSLIMTKNQTLMTSGLYTYVRHPGYTGTIIAGIGFGLVLANLLSLIFITILMTIVYIIHILNGEYVTCRTDFSRKINNNLVIFSSKPIKYRVPRLKNFIKKHFLICGSAIFVGSNIEVGFF